MTGREWAKGFSPAALYLADELCEKGECTIVDCGAGEGRHCVYAAKLGARVIAIEIDPEQAAIILKKKEAGGFHNLEVVEGDVMTMLPKIINASVDGIIDVGMSHYLAGQQKARFAALVHSKLRAGGLYATSHFSDNEPPHPEGGIHTATLKELRQIYPECKWQEAKAWQEVKWAGSNNITHSAWTAVLKKV